MTWTDQLGRKNAMFVVNIPIIIGWFIMYMSTEVWHIFFANVLLGFGAGLMEASCNTYVSWPVRMNWNKITIFFQIFSSIFQVGEISDPKFRGIMLAYTHIGYTLGMLFVSILNTMMSWRMVALICISVPLLTIVVLCFVSILEENSWLYKEKK